MRKYIDIINEESSETNTTTTIGNYSVDLVEFCSVDPYYHIRGKLVTMTRGYFKLGQLIIAGYEYIDSNKITLRINGYAEKFTSMDDVRNHIKSRI